MTTQSIVSWTAALLVMAGGLYLMVDGAHDISRPVAEAIAGPGSKCVPVGPRDVGAFLCSVETEPRYCAPFEGDWTCVDVSCHAPGVR